MVLRLRNSRHWPGVSELSRRRLTALASKQGPVTSGPSDQGSTNVEPCTFVLVCSKLRPQLLSGYRPLPKANWMTFQTDFDVPELVLYDLLI